MIRPRLHLLIGMACLCMLLLSGCSKSPTKPNVDTTAPEVITDLSEITISATTVTLAWSSPGDDGAVGTASFYDVRYSTAPITPATFAAATKVTGEPKPAVAGTDQFMDVTGLASSTTYYFAMESSDKVGNVSGLSNVISFTTHVGLDATPPAAITDLAVRNVASSRIALSWTAPGDDGTVGTATSYDLRYSTSAIDDANFATATQLLGMSAPHVAGSTDTVVVEGLAGSTTYYFAIKTSDEIPNISALSNVVTATIPASMFATAQKFTTGMGPRTVVVADFNGDGKADLATANFFDGSVSVLLGAGNGTFGSKTDYSAGASPFFMATGKFNNDLAQDLVVTNFYDNTVSVLLGNGGGGFGSATAYATGTTPVSVGVGDVNGDHVLDLAAANLSDNTVSLLAGYSTGAFGTHFDYATGSSPWSSRIADVNGDGNGDFVFTNLDDQTVSVRLGDGSYGFGAKTDYVTGVNPYCVAIGDVNADGKLDLVVANGGSHSVSVLLGHGDGTFGTETEFNTGADPRSVAIGDIDGDGKMDLVTANYSDNSVSVLLGNGNGTFQLNRDFASGKWANSVELADFNGDGRLDLAVANYGDNTVSVLLNNGVVTVAARPAHVVPPRRPVVTSRGVSKAVPRR